MIEFQTSFPALLDADTQSRVSARMIYLTQITRLTGCESGKGQPKRSTPKRANKFE